MTAAARSDDNPDPVPDRIIRDRARRSPTLQRQSNASERAWWRLEVACDDYGRFDADPQVLLADLFPRRPSGWTANQMRTVLHEWIQPGEDGDPELVHLYRVDGDRRVYGHAITFLKHQRERGSKPKFPDPPCGGSPQFAAKCRESLQVAAPSESREPRAESREPRGDTRARDAAARRILEILNSKAEKTFAADQTNLGFILARLREGATEQDCRAVIARKVRQWKGDPKMHEYLRPSTLFNRTKFSGYVGEAAPEPTA